jgi:hypothetical protein
MWRTRAVAIAALALAGLALPACSGGSGAAKNLSTAPSNVVATTSPTVDTTTVPVETTVPAPTTTITTPPTTAPPPPPTTAPSAPSAQPFISVPGTESTLSNIASGFSDSLGWHYSKSQGDWEGNTGDNFCQISIVNSEGEASNLADNVVFTCGLPTNPSAVSQTDAQEEALFTTTLVGQDVGPPAAQWLSQQVIAAGNGSGVVTQKLFTGPLGPIEVQLNIGNGQSTIGIITGY